MRYRAPSLFLALLLALTAGRAQTLAVGSPAPELQATRLADGTRFQLSALRGKVVIVNLWATWCVPCREEMPLLQSYYLAHHEQGLEVLAISMDSARDLGKVRQIAQQFSFDVAFKDDADIKALGRVWRLPTTFVVDRDGVLRKNGHVGDAELSASELDTVVTPLLLRAANARSP